MEYSTNLIMDFILEVMYHFESVSISKKNNNITLWHIRSGHPISPYLKHLIPKLFSRENPSLLHYETCQFAKHHRSSLLTQPYKQSKPFVVIHIEVWSLNKIITFSKRWFVTLFRTIIELVGFIYQRKNLKFDGLSNSFLIVIVFEKERSMSNEL